MSADAELRRAKGAWRDWLGLLRPSQWTKNSIVLVAYFFARWDPGQSAHALGRQPFLISLLAMADFCLLASGVYILNDVLDREADARHPEKRLRPIAAGKIAPPAALLLAAALAALLVFGAR